MLNKSGMNISFASACKLIMILVLGLDLDEVQTYMIVSALIDAYSLIWC